MTRAKEELECCICLTLPKTSTAVYSCVQHHLLCDICSKKWTSSCPVCRQDFQKEPPKRNPLAEKLILALT